MNLHLPHDVVVKRMLSAPPLALQFYLAGLSVGMSSIYCFGNTRAGRASGSFSIGVNVEMCVGMAHQQQRRDRDVQGRLVSISKNMSRASRHGARRNESPRPLDLEDGGSILVSTLIDHPTFQQLNNQRGDITQCALKKSNPAK